MNGGWNRPSGNAVKSGGNAALKPTVIVGLAIAVVAVAVSCYVMSKGERGVGKEDADAKGLIQAVSPSLRNPAVQSQSVSKVSRPKPAEAESADDAPKPEYVKRPGQMQLPNGKVLTFPPPKEGETRNVFANGRIYVCDHLGNFTDVTRRQLFKTAFEQNFLALANEGKTFIPAFLTGLDEAEVKKLLVKNYQAKGDETAEEMKELKAYDDMRCAALDYMDQGGKFDDFVNEYASFERQQRETRAMTLREVMTLYKEGKISEAKEMAEAASLLLEKKGYKPMTLPPHVLNAFGSVH